jgi:hypothetical protein
MGDNKTTRSKRNRRRSGYRNVILSKETFILIFKIELEIAREEKELKEIEAEEKELQTKYNSQVLKTQELNLGLLDNEVCV